MRCGERHSLRRKDFFRDRIVRIPDRVEGVESVSVVRRQRKLILDSDWKIGIRNEVATKRHGVNCSRTVIAQQTIALRGW